MRENGSVSTKTFVHIALLIFLAGAVLAGALTVPRLVEDERTTTVNHTTSNPCPEKASPFKGMDC